MRRLLLLIVLSGFFVPSFSKLDTTYTKRIYTTSEVTTPLAIDGWINDGAWDQVSWDSEFQMHDPYDDRPASQITDFKVVFDRENIYVDDENLYSITESGSGLNYHFGNPDFNIKEFLSNMVFRWEYRPGSFLYLVWSQNRSAFDSYGIFEFEDDFRDIWKIHPKNVLMLKVSYRIGR